MGRRCRKLGPRPPCFGRSCSFHRRGASCCSFPWVGGQGGAARDGPLCRGKPEGVCACVCGGGVGGMASARQRSWELGVAALLTFGPGSVTRQTLAVKQPTTWLSVVRVGVRVETRRSFSRPFPRSPRSVLPAKVGLRPSAQPLVNTTAIASMRKHKPAFFLNRGPRLGSTLSSLSEQTRGGKNV